MGRGVALRVDGLEGDCWSDLEGVLWSDLEGMGWGDLDGDCWPDMEGMDWQDVEGHGPVDNEEELHCFFTHLKGDQRFCNPMIYCSWFSLFFKLTLMCRPASFRKFTTLPTVAALKLLLLQ